MLASGLWWIVVGRGGARHGGERGRMGKDGRGKMGKPKWEENKSGVRGAGLLRNIPPNILLNVTFLKRWECSRA